MARIRITLDFEIPAETTGERCSNDVRKRIRELFPDAEVINASINDGHIRLRELQC